MPGFFDTHPLYRRSGPGDGTPIGAAAMPAALSALLHDVAGNRYARGFWHFADPTMLRACMAPWRLDRADCYPFLKGAFGHIVFLQGVDCKVLNPVFNDVDLLGSAEDLGFVLDILLCDRPALEASFLIDLYEAAWPRLGEPSDDEIYALVPALGLGGQRDASHVHRRPMAMEMQLLAHV